MAGLPHAPVPPEAPKSSGWFLRLARQRQWFHAALIDPGRGERKNAAKAPSPDAGRSGKER